MAIVEPSNKPVPTTRRCTSLSASRRPGKPINMKRGGKPVVLTAPVMISPAFAAEPAAAVAVRGA